MFTGIVKDVGTVERIAPRLRVATSLAGRLEVDDSVNVSGVCLTVIARDGKGFECDVVEETRRRSTLGALRPGSRVNLEAAATPETSLGGHFVQGHVDGTSALVAHSGERLRFALDRAWARYVVEKGFIALDGVSLTVAGLGADDFEIALIPHTASRTTLGAVRQGDAVNVEVDILAKYVERLLAR
ncbi:MAG: riboflavin synthase [Chloroflexi bacterium]|nr:MAG: riboflavin synthase [Chloroflexota bacterium]